MNKALSRTEIAGVVIAQRRYIRSGFLLCAALSMLLFLLGCIGSPEATKEETEAAKRFESLPGGSVVYIYRDTMVAAIQTFRLYIDGRLIGDLKNRAFFRIVIPPGAHTINVTNMRNVVQETTSIRTDGGKVYCMEMEIGANAVSGIPKLVVVEDQVSMPKIKPLKLLVAGTTAMSN